MTEETTRRRSPIRIREVFEEDVVEGRRVGRIVDPQESSAWIRSTVTVPVRP